MEALRTHLRNKALSGLALPAAPASLPLLTWAGALTGTTAASTLPNGVVIDSTDPRLGGPVRHRYDAILAGNPLVNGLPCRIISRPYTCRGTSRNVGSTTILRLRTDAPVLEVSGVVTDGASAVQALIVDDRLVPPKVLSSDRTIPGGWNAGTLRFDFGSRQTRDIWIATSMAVAFVKIDAQDVLLGVDDGAEPQITVVGDSYLAASSNSFGSLGGIAMELGARLGMRKVATDGIGGTGFWNTNGDTGNLNHRLAAHAADNSSVYLVMAGLNDYGDFTGNQLVWPTRATYEQAVLGYLQALRQAQPNALIVMTAPFCPIPSLSDSTYVANPGTNTSGKGDFLYREELFRNSLSQIAGPWVYIDVLLGGGWRNSSGANGDVTGLQWFTGGTPAPGTTSSFKPGNTDGGGGGGYGGISAVPLLGAGKYSQAPEVIATGGSGSGLLLAASVDTSGRIVAIRVLSQGSGYTAGSGLPVILIDSTYEITPATAGTPILVTATNPNGQYPLLSFAPPGTSAADLNNIYRLLADDKVHPSPLGTEYLSRRLARNIYDAVMAL